MNLYYAEQSMKQSLLYSYFLNSLEWYVALGSLEYTLPGDYVARLYSIGEGEVPDQTPDQRENQQYQRHRDDGKPAAKDNYGNGGQQQSSNRLPGGEE
jgi:hypothetical protein